MYLHVDHNSGVPISAQLIDQIKYLVVSGRLEPGEQIPSVRALAADLKLNPTTVARVYQQLEAEEIIYTQHGRGTFIARRRSALTATEKRERVRSDIRALVVECARIGMDYEEMIKLIRQEIEGIQRKGGGS